MLLFPKCDIIHWPFRQTVCNFTAQITEIKFKIKYLLILIFPESLLLQILINNKINDKKYISLWFPFAMADEGDKKKDARVEYIKERINGGFPKLAGPKLDKLLATDEVR